MRKEMPEWDPEPYFVRLVKGSMITAQRGVQVLARNSSFFKRFSSGDMAATKPHIENKIAERCVEAPTQSGHEVDLEAAAIEQEQDSEAAAQLQAPNDVAATQPTNELVEHRVRYMRHHTYPN